MSDAVVEDQTVLNDTVLLEGQEFIVRGAIAGKPIAEFTSGIKIGAATYDEREHAFFAVLDDFSGGWGHRVLNVREALGTHWDNRGGVDLRRGRHITLPAIRTTVSPNANPAAVALFSIQRSARVSDVGNTEYLQIGIGGSMFTLSANRATLTRRQNLTNFDRINRVLEFAPQTSGGTRHLLAFGFGTAGRGYYYSTDGTTWTNRAGRDINEGIVWDGQVIGLDNKVFVSSADPSLATNWDLDLAGAEPHWIAGGYPHIIGVGMAPWGASAIYFIDQGSLFVLDWYVYNAIRVEDVGDLNQLAHGVIWNGSIFLHDNRQIWEYTPGGSVRNLGPFAKDGAPPSWATEGWTLHQFLAGTSHLFLLAHAPTGTAPNATYKMRLLVYNGAGWSWFGPEVTSSEPFVGTIDRFPLNPSLTVASRAIDVVALGNQPGASTPDNSLVATLHTWALPNSSDVPYTGSDARFEDGPLAFETGWFDGGFADLDGALFRVQIDAFSMSDSETVKVEYRLNNDETANYEVLGTFTKNQDRRWFDDAKRGLAFRTVQFRVTLDRGSTTTRSPELKALILVFNKKPKLRTAWTFSIDVNAMIKDGVDVGGEPATYHNIWEKLRGLWNTQELLRFVIPTFTDDIGMNVAIAGMDMSFDDWRDSVKAKGATVMQVLEVVVDE